MCTCTVTNDLESVIKRLESRVSVLEKSSSVKLTTTTVCSTETVENPSVQVNGIAANNDSKDEDEDDFELFGDDDNEVSLYLSAA